MRKYLKIKKKSIADTQNFKNFKALLVLCFSRKRVGVVLAVVAMLLVLNSCLRGNDYTEVTLVDDDVMIHSMSQAMAVASTKRGIITIPANTVKANPFLPYRDIEGLSSGSDIPEYDLVPPPTMVDVNSDAARVMDTIVSGILYDKYSPSAIINIEGSDYLVKKGDIVNGYKVLSILKDSVSVQLGSNVYKAGIGEILTEGEINHNEVSNLNKKFGGIR